jgi:Uma2 family endonuclease
MQTLNPSPPLNAFETEDSLAWYYELYPEEYDMAETLLHRDLGDYLRQVLKWYFYAQSCLILANQLVFRKGLYTSPDIAVIKDVNLPKHRKVTSWKVTSRRKAPNVTLEISSSGNWDKDILLDKLVKSYAELGVGEYFAFDPEGFWGEEERLKGWRNDGGAMRPLPLEGNKIWSNELNCWLVAGHEWLWLEDGAGKVLLTGAGAGGSGGTGKRI